MSENAGPASFGRVAEDGTVYVRTADGERSVGQIPDATPDEAMEFFTKRFIALGVEVDLLEQRIKGGTVAPDDARHSINVLRKSISEANAVGDLASLEARLEALAPELAKADEKRKAEKAEAQAAAKQAKEEMVAEAEKIAAGTDWRGGVNRFRALLDQWKALPRIDRATDDELWHRFSSARTAYTRKRKANFAEQNEKRELARAAKERILEEARPLAESTEWGPTTGAFRDLMQRWKAAGAAPREVEDTLWTEFRALQDQFFNAKQAEMATQDAEFAENLTAKEALLAQAEADILPVEDLEAAKQAYRAFLAKYNELGKVPRDAIRPLDQRLRKLESAVNEAEQAEWKRTDPEARKRAEDTITMFSAHIEKLEAEKAKAEAKGDNKKVRDAEKSIATYTEWLDQAKATLADFVR